MLANLFARLQDRLPNVAREIWLLAFGRLLSQIGSGFILFYAPIFYVDRVGLSATLVGIGIGSAQQTTGILGRYFGGVFADSPTWGRRRTLLLSAGVSAIADLVLALTYDYPIFLVGNLLMGLGIGLYWPATEAAVADLTRPEQRNEAYAVTRLADSLGLSVGVLAGGAIVSASGNYRSLFVLDGITFAIFFAAIYFTFAETYRPEPDANGEYRNPNFGRGWGAALRDSRLTVYLAVNILFTTLISQTQSTLPLYFDTYVPAGKENRGFSASTISALFAWHIVFSAIAQLPVARQLNRMRRTDALRISLSLWALGFIGIWATGGATEWALGAAIAALGILALAIVSYTPSASALVADIAPKSARGIYSSLNSQCWAIGYFIGPPLGGWALDQNEAIARNFWLVGAISTLGGIAILRGLDRILLRSQRTSAASKPSRSPQD
ncbi:arabinose efflux permease [Rubidibacter lacunae KORDI 51-2]|uniref:Arabinose efflux permease n=1 Tax=Rubidibacter lacunae KORDI 51-2 TaxID=582515 RepID=U5DL99_9CHRO|nr:MFS transporter [Rubidibacter lacunae]ERN41642.1 arabinose efflux permease [Rubidibacter lacunae KORDI 51-2]